MSRETSATAENVRVVVSGLDHAECVAFSAGGALYAGGEAGQIYRIDVGAGTFAQVASVGDGLVLGVTVDGDENVYACVVGNEPRVVKVAAGGEASIYSRGLDAKGWLVNPNYSVFDSAGNLYFSESGDYYKSSGKLYVVRPDGKTEVVHEGPLDFPNGIAIDPTGKWLYVILSTAPAVVRLPMDNLSGAPEVVVRFPAAHVPDGIAFAADGRMVISCYTPDRIYTVGASGELELLLSDPTSERLNRPTNIALRDGKIYIANLGGWHVGEFDAGIPAAPLHYPRF